MPRPDFYSLSTARSGLKSAVVLLTALFLAVFANAARAETPAGCASPPTSELVAYRCKFYDGDMANAVVPARDWIKWRAAYAHNPALVLDIDETSLSTWEVMYHNHFVYVADGPCNLRKASLCGQRAWEHMARAPAIKPTRDLFDFAKARHVAVFFVTGRDEAAVERAATEQNLRRAGYAGWKHLYFRTGGFGGVGPFKTWARGQIEAHGYTIIANVGDQWSDLDGGHAERVFKLPNPFYTIP